MVLLEIGTAVVTYYTGHAYGHACKQTHFDVKGACELPCTGGWYDAFYKARRTNSGMQSMQPLTPYRLSAQCPYLTQWLAEEIMWRAACRPSISLPAC